MIFRFRDSLVVFFALIVSCGQEETNKKAGEGGVSLTPLVGSWSTGCTIERSSIDGITSVNNTEYFFYADGTLTSEYLSYPLTATECTGTPVMALEMKAKYSGGVSLESPAGARTLDFKPSTVKVTVYDQATIEGIKGNAPSCDIELGVSKELINNLQCPIAGEDVTNGNEAYDIWIIENEQLRFGKYEDDVKYTAKQRQVSFDSSVYTRPQ